MGLGSASRTTLTAVVPGLGAQCLGLRTLYCCAEPPCRSVSKPLNRSTSSQRLIVMGLQEGACAFPGDEMSRDRSLPGVFPPDTPKLS